MNKTLKKMGNHRKWYGSEDRIFDHVNGYFIQIGSTGIMDNPNFKFIEVDLPIELEESSKSEIIAVLEERKKEIGFSVIQLNGQRLYFQFNQNLKYVKEEKLTKAVDTITQVLDSMNVSKEIGCRNCTKKDRIDIYHLNNQGIILCENCAEELGGSFKKENEAFKNQGTRYLAGFGGALLFSMGGVVLWVLVAVFLNYITTLGAFVIAFLSFLGYDYFKGKPDKNKKYFVILAGVLSIIIANVATYFIGMSWEGIAFSDAMELLRIPEVWNNLQSNLLLSLVFGAVVWFFMLFDKGRENLSLEKAMRMHPMRG
jgi:hypothetical protein